MPVSKNVETVLSSLQRYGVNPQTIAAMRKELDGNKAANNYLNEGVIRRNQFTEYVTKAEQEKRDLQAKVQELATLHDAANSTTFDAAIAKDLTEKIAAIEDFLIEQGYDEDEVRSISFKEKTALTESLRQENLQAKETIEKVIEKKEEEEEMPGKYIDEETFQGALQTGLANMTLAQMDVNSQIYRTKRQYERLAGKDAKDDLIDGFDSRVKDSILKGENKTIEQLAEEHFGISAIQKARNDAEIEQRIEAARKEERARINRENGVPARNSLRKGGSPVFRDKRYETSTSQQTSQQVDNPERNPQTSQEVPTGMVRLANDKIVPVNKDGIPEYFRGRRTREERIDRATNFYNDVVERVGEEGERMGFLE